MQFGFAMMPFGRTAALPGLTSGTTNGTCGSIRNAPELSTTTAPRSAATGAHRADTSSGTSNMATSTPSNTHRPVPPYTTASTSSASRLKAR